MAGATDSRIAQPLRRAAIRWSSGFAFLFNRAIMPIEAIKPERVFKISPKLIHLTEQTFRIGIQTRNKELDDGAQRRPELNLLAHRRRQAPSPDLDVAPATRPVPHLPRYKLK